jgi:hypothetical protein
LAAPPVTQIKNPDVKAGVSFFWELASKFARCAQGAVGPTDLIRPKDSVAGLDPRHLSVVTISVIHVHDGIF